MSVFVSNFFRDAPVAIKGSGSGLGFARDEAREGIPFPIADSVEFVLVHGFWAYRADHGTN